MNINPEFKNFLPITPEQKLGLEQQIISDGKILYPLIIGKYPKDGGFAEELIDGHCRYEIAKKNKLLYKTETLNFENIEEVYKWIFKQQKNKRNWNEWMEYEAVQKLKVKLLEIGKETQGQRTDLLPIISKKSPHNTQKEISEELGWGHDKVARADIVSKNATAEIKEKLKTQKISINEAYKETKKKMRKQLQVTSTSNPLPSNIKILEGDLFEMLKQIPDKSIDLLNTDPPYFILEEKWDTFKNKEEYLTFTQRWLDAVITKVKDTGRIYISFAHDYQFDFCNLLLKNNFFGFIFGNMLIWYYKNNNKMFDRKRYRFAYEPIFYLYGKNAPTLNLSPDTFGEMQQNVWEIATPQSNFKEGKLHPAQKPLELYRRIIKTGSFEGDTVLDCFAGSGTSGVICKETNRNCILIEKEKENINIIKSRL